MSLIKILGVEDELVFDLGSMAAHAKQISIILVRRAGKSAVFEISADRSIPINQFRIIEIDGKKERIQLNKRL